jgi:hypothetical protein
MTQQLTLAELLRAAAHRLAEYRLKLDGQMTERGRGIVSVVSVIATLSDIGPLMIEAVKALEGAQTRANDKDIQWRAWADDQRRRAARPHRVRTSTQSRAR